MALAIRFPRRILALFRRPDGAGFRSLAMSSIHPDPSAAAPPASGAAPTSNGSGHANGNGNGNAAGGERPEKWEKDSLSFMPLYDRGSPVSLAPSADGPIATLARIELNARRKVALNQGLAEDQLNTPGSP